MANKDNYYRQIAETVARQSKCLSRKIGAVLVKNDSIISTGYNGPPRGIPTCGYRMTLHEECNLPPPSDLAPYDQGICPRRQLGLKSGEGLSICPAGHAEANAIFNAARVGVQTFGATLYLTCEIPCKDCLAAIIGAGISRVVCTSNKHYSPLSSFLLKHAQLLVETYEEE